MNKIRTTDSFLTETSRRTVIRKAGVRRAEYMDGSDVTCSTTTTTIVIEEDRLLSFESIIMDATPQPLWQPVAATPVATGRRSVGGRKGAAWEMTAEAFRALLAQLDADLDRAGEKYALLRQKLAKFFERRGCHTPAEMADETINRVARRLAEGKEILAGEPARYFYGVARNVLREYRESRARQSWSLDDISQAEHPCHDPVEVLARAELRDLYERRLEKLETCLAQLPPAHRDLLLRYYCGEQRDRIDGRRELAARLGITVNALKIRVLRLRKTLAHRINDLLARQEQI
jgi:RNA polymerase sigma factor (sigma-70 family)